MQYYLAFRPEDPRPAGTYETVWAAYRVGTHLFSCMENTTLHGGWMLLSAQDDAVPADGVAREVLCECLRRSFGGVVLDWDRHNTALSSLCAALDQLLPPYRLRLFVPETYAPSAPHSTVVINTAVVGGTLESCLTDAVRHFGANRIALDMERLALDFTLPRGKDDFSHLSLDRLNSLSAGRVRYLSDELCARYFTYREGETSHYVLFDDARTLLRKCALAEKMMIREVFFMLPEIRDIAQALLCEAKKEEPPDR